MNKTSGIFKYVPVVLMNIIFWNAHSNFLTNFCIVFSYKIYMMRVNMNKHAGRGYQREESPWQHTFHVDSRFLKEDAASLNLRHDFLKWALAGIGYITLLLLLKRGVCLWWCRWLLGKKRICFSHALHLCLIVAGCCCAALFSGLFCLFRW